MMKYGNLFFLFNYLENILMIVLRVILFASLSKRTYDTLALN